MTPPRMVWPERVERALLGRFYLASTIGQATAIIQPFEFAYLFLVMERPEWAVIPFLVSSAIVLGLEIPTGLLSDRWSRKKTVVIGYALSGLSWALVPFAVSFHGTDQLVAVCACFVLDGLGETLVSGADDAWVVDNLKSAGREDLVDQYFARVLSVESFGGMVAGTLALAVLIAAATSRPVLDMLWYATAAGQFVVVAMFATIPERRPGNPRHVEGERIAPPLKDLLLAGLAVIRARPLLFFLLAMVIASFADSIVGDAFVMSMVTKGLDARALAPLAIVEDFLGLVFPMIGLAVARLMGAPRFLSLFLLLSALAASVLFAQPALWVVIALVLFLDVCEVVWNPVANAALQSMIPSEHRATMASIVNQLSGLAELAGYGVFALILGQHSEALQEATPDLVDAFSGAATAVTEVPTALFGLPVPDFAIVLFLFSGLAAIPLLLVERSRRAGNNDTEVEGK